MGRKMHRYGTYPPIRTIERNMLFSRVGLFTLQFALSAAPIYMDSLNVEQLHRSILIELGACLRNSLATTSDTVPTQSDWVLGEVPTSHALKKILQKAKSRLDPWRRELEDTLAIIDGQVLRTDGHFKLPQEIILETGYPSRAMLAVLGRNGFLLREVLLAESESTDAYLRAISPILDTRYAYGHPPPRIISDNQGMIQGEIHEVIREIWGGLLGFYTCRRPGSKKSGIPGVRR